MCVDLQIVTDFFTQSQKMCFAMSQRCEMEQKSTKVLASGLEKRQKIGQKRQAQSARTQINKSF